MRFTKLSLVFVCFLSWHVCSLAQGDDIIVVDSTSIGWGDDIGGGLNPNEPNEPVTSLTLSKSQITLEEGERVRLVASVNAKAKDKRIIWSSDNSNVASVETDGTVMGRSVGTTTITATAAGNTALKKTCRVLVTHSSSVLPNVPFEFLFAAADYDETTHSIPNHIRARLKETRLQLTENLPTVVEDGKALRISDRCEGFLDRWDKWSNESGAYFYRGGQDCMTIVAKVAPRLNTGNACDFIANRGNAFNYMWRIGDNNKSFLHTNYAYDDNRTLPISSEQPQVFAVRVDGVNDYILLQNLTTQELRRVEGVHWGDWDSVFKVFYNDGGEYFQGDFYWVYYSFELLTDEQLAKFGRSDFEDGIKDLKDSKDPKDLKDLKDFKDDSLYDLSGRKMLDNSKLSRGIYIINNRKVLFR